jgi:UbiD family decarboxylase
VAVVPTEQITPTSPGVTAPRKDMRTWIDELERAGELIRVDKPVDPLTQMGALLYQSREKAIFFENLPHGWRSLGQAPANVRQAALACDRIGKQKH